ncbi:sugar transferase [Amaricoccus solimangrovi]|uniref:sugar transferase n=1 Tax=Amaricoccus solimangrovi TaxID=2589815 RepID=UPI003F67F9D7
MPRSGGFYRTRGKRVFDIVVASLMLVAFAPLMLALTALVAIDGGRPFYAHPRVGLRGRTFGCLKFRSMCLGAAEMLPRILASDPVAAAEWEADHKLTNDPRVTRIGAFLRKSSLDELPQLFCVLRGDMSLVGPRPITEPELFRYGPARSAYLAMRPGLTGPWQVKGRNDISYDNRVTLDVNYGRKVTFRRDVKIMALTALSMLRLTGR